MSTVIYLQGPHEFTARLIRKGGPDAFATLDTGAASLFLYSRADCDALIGAALAARGMLPEPGVPVAATHCPDCGEAVSPVNGTCPCCIPLLQPAHGENHIDNAGHATLACAGQCLPGTCITCGATVSAAGVVTLAATA